jgi:DNA phosphorothioation-dependent restriction protein DptG
MVGALLQSSVEVGQSSMLAGEAKAVLATDGNTAINCLQNRGRSAIVIYFNEHIHLILLPCYVMTCEPLSQSLLEIESS